MDFSNYIFRCSALGKLLSKSGKFTDGNKTYLNELFVGAINGVRKEASSKYFEKGLFEEESGITLLNKALYPNSICVKNKERKSNEWINGEMDCKMYDIVYDIKNAWDVFTFGNADLTHEYEWQLRGYMWLWNVRNARLFYCLNNTPDHIFESEARKMLWNNFTSEDSPEYIEAYQNLKAKHTHENKPLWERFKVWDIAHDDNKIGELKTAIATARKYLCELWNEHEATIAKNKMLMGIVSEIPPITIHDQNITIHDSIKA